MTKLDIDEMHPEVGHISHLSNESIVIYQDEGGEWIESTVKEVLEMESSEIDVA